MLYFSIMKGIVWKSLENPSQNSLLIFTRLLNLISGTVCDLQASRPSAASSGCVRLMLPKMLEQDRCKASGVQRRTPSTPSTQHVQSRQETGKQDSVYQFKKVQYSAHVQIFIFHLELWWNSLAGSIIK